MKLKGSQLKAMQACASKDARRHDCNAVHIKYDHLQATNQYVWVDVKFDERLCDRHYELDNEKIKGLSSTLRLTPKELIDFAGREPGRFPKQDIYDSYNNQRELFEQDEDKGIRPTFLKLITKVFDVFDAPMHISIRGSRSFVLVRGYSTEYHCEIHAVVASCIIKA